MKKQSLNIKKLIFFLFLFCKIADAQQIIYTYGGYIQSVKDANGNYSFKITVYLPLSNTLDSIFIAGVYEAKWYKRVESTTICNSINKSVYLLNNAQFSSDPPNTINADFFKQPVRFIGKNVDTLALPNFTQTAIFDAHPFDNYINNSSTFNDYPLIVVRKNQSTVVNFMNNEPDGKDSVIFDFGETRLANSPKTPKGFALNRFTGDFLISGKFIDTGYYSVVLVCQEYSKNISPKSLTVLGFTVLVVDKQVPYFIPYSIIDKDSFGIPYLKTSPSVKTLNYQTDYINNSSFGKNYTVNFQSSLVFNKSPQILSTKLNDSTLRINLTLYMDTGFYKIYENLPKSFSIIVTVTDSLGNCKQDLTSFYLTNNSTNSIVEVNEKNKISVYPNPATNKINILFEGNIPKNIVANIYDSKGSLVITETMEGNEINTTNLAQGLYLLTIENEGKRYSTKFVKE